MRAATERAHASSRKRRWLVSASLYALLTALFASATLGYHELVDYIEHDPAFCRNCHVSQREYTLWTESEHQQIVCQECHHQSRREALSLLRKFVFEGRTGDDRDHTLHESKVEGSACARCHASHDRGWPEIGESVGHKAHLGSAQVSCMQCHARSIHSFGTASDACLECHEERSLRTSGMERLHCLACHNFLTKTGSIRPSRAICNDCHRARRISGPIYPEDAPMATFTCWECHLPHAPEGARAVGCEGCHDEMARAGLHGSDEHRECTTCHAAHTWIPTAQACIDCHDDAAEHARGEGCWNCHSFDQNEGSPETGTP